MACANCYFFALVLIFFSQRTTSRARCLADDETSSSSPSVTHPLLIVVVINDQLSHTSTLHFRLVPSSLLSIAPLQRSYTSSRQSYTRKLGRGTFRLAATSSRQQPKKPFAKESSVGIWRRPKPLTFQPSLSLTLVRHRLGHPHLHRRSDSAAPSSILPCT